MGPFFQGANCGLDVLKGILRAPSFWDVWFWEAKRIPLSWVLYFETPDLVDGLGVEEKGVLPVFWGSHLNTLMFELGNGLGLFWVQPK